MSAPKCKRANCGNPAMQGADGKWLECCSDSCADKEIYDRQQLIMSIRFCGTIALLVGGYFLVTQGPGDLDGKGVLGALGGLAVAAATVWAYCAKVPKSRSNVAEGKRQSARKQAAPHEEGSSNAKPTADGSGVEILFGARTIERLGKAPRKVDDLPVFLARDVASLAALPGHLSRCVFKCCHIIPNHPRPENDVIQAWGAALGSDLERALAGGAVRQVLAPVPETGELVLYVFWDNGASRAQVERLGTTMQALLRGQ